MAIMNEAQLRRIIREEIKKTKSSIKFISPVAIKKWITQLVKQTKTNPPHDGFEGLQYFIQVDADYMSIFLIVATFANGEVYDDYFASCELASLSEKAADKMSDEERWTMLSNKLEEAAQLCEKAGIKVDIEREMNKPENEEEEI